MNRWATVRSSLGPKSCFDLDSKRKMQTAKSQILTFEFVSVYLYKYACMYTDHQCMRVSARSIGCNVIRPSKKIVQHTVTKLFFLRSKNLEVRCTWRRPNDVTWWGGSKYPWCRLGYAFFTIWVSNSCFCLACTKNSTLPDAHKLVLIDMQYCKLGAVIPKQLNEDYFLMSVPTYISFYWFWLLNPAGITTSQVEAK